MKALPTQLPTLHFVLRPSRLLTIISIWLIASAELDTVAQPSHLQINELLASNVTGLRDNFGKSSDWLEIHNPGPQAVDLEGLRLTDALDRPLRWCFPTFLLPPGEHLLVWMSGRKNNPDKAPISAPVTVDGRFHRTIIPEGASWKYWTEHLDAPWPGIDEWISTEFDDEPFPEDRAGFGFGDGDDRTEFHLGTTLVLLRREFEWNSRSSSPLVLRVNYDDGFVAYLNGKRVAAANAPDQALDQQSLATDNHEAETAEAFDLTPYRHLLREGSNLLAIVGLNLNRQSSDFSIHPSLGTLAPVFHANFKLNKGGGNLFLLGSNSTVIDHVKYPKQLTDRSWGRAHSSEKEWGYFIAPTPNSENPGSVQHRVFEAPKFSPRPGVYTSLDQVLLQKDLTQHQIRFTTDGRDPGAESRVYQDGIQITQPVTIRAAVFSGPDRISPITTGTFWTGDRPNLPVLAVSMRPEHFREVQLNARATGKPSERAAFLELIAPNGPRITATGFGLRLHGGAGRNGGFEKKKSYRTYFRKAYGVSRLNNDLIPDTQVADFDKLVLRSNSNDRGPGGSNIRDQVIRDLHRDMGGLAAHGDWCILLVNSQNRGVYNLTERMDEEFFISHLGPGKYDVIKTGETVLNGNRDAWNELRRFVESRSFASDEAYEALKQQVDIENFTSYVILNLCMQNFDWPHNNWYAAKRRKTGRWIFLCWDAEWGLGYRHPHSGDSPVDIAIDPYAFMDSGGAAGHSMTRLIFLALMANKDYRQYYQQEVKRHLQGALSQRNILHHIHRHRDAIARDLATEYKRSIQSWKAEIREIEDYAHQCGAIFQKHTDAYFKTEIQTDARATVTLLQGDVGRHEVFYRSANDGWRQISVTAASKVQDNSVLQMPPAAPAITGAPIAFRSDPNSRHLVYRDAKGALHELIQSEASRNKSAWAYHPIPADLKLPAAISDPVVAIHRGIPHVIYLDETGLPHEIWRDKKWRHHPLLAAPRPGSNLSVTVTSEALHVLYRTQYGAPCKQRLDWHEAHEGRRIWRTELILQVPTASRPVGLDAGDRWRTLFRPAQDWPQSEPYVFHWDGPQGKGYQEYKGPRSGLVEAMNQRQRFHRLTPLRNEIAAPAIGNPIAINGNTDQQSFICYRDETGQLHEAHWSVPGKNDQEGWQIQNITHLASAPPAATDPVGLMDASASSRCYVYPGKDGKLHELRFDERWNHVILATDVASH